MERGDGFSFKLLGLYWSDKFVERIATIPNDFPWMIIAEINIDADGKISGMFDDADWVGNISGQLKEGALELTLTRSKSEHHIYPPVTVTLSKDALHPLCGGWLGRWKCPKAEEDCKREGGIVCSIVAI